MFPQFKKPHNESGIVLFITLMVAIIIIMILSVGLLTQSMNETNYAQQQIDQIVSDQLAKGVFWNAYANSYLTSGGANVGISTVMQGRNYYVTLNDYGTSPSGIVNWVSSANYDSFQ